MDAIATRTARNPRSNARDDVHDRFSCDIPHAYARASRARTRARLAAPFANGRIHHPSSGDTRESPIHPSIHPRRSCAIVTYLARAHGDRSSSLRRVLDVGRHHGRGAGESRSHDWSWSRCDDEARLAQCRRASATRQVRSRVEASMPGRDRSIVGGDGRRAGRMSEHTHTAGAIAATEVATWARVGAHYARARPRRCG